MSPRILPALAVLAALAAHAGAESWFNGAQELRVKESDRVRAIVRTPKRSAQRGP